MTDNNVVVAVFKSHGNPEVAVNEVQNAKLRALTAAGSNLVLLAAIVLGFTLTTVDAQTNPANPSGVARPGPDFTGYLSRLSTDNPAYTASLEFHSYGAASGDAIAAQGKLAYLNGQTRFEMDMGGAGDASLPSEDASSLAQMGMNTMIAISCPERKVNFFVYPGRKAYVWRPIPASTADDCQIDVTQVGAENVQGQNCVKNKVIATGPDGIPRESTVWNTTDLNKFQSRLKQSKMAPPSS